MTKFPTTSDWFSHLFRHRNVHHMRLLPLRKTSGTAHSSMSHFNPCWINHWILGYTFRSGQSNQSLKMECQTNPRNHFSMKILRKVWDQSMIHLMQCMDFLRPWDFGIPNQPHSPWTGAEALALEVPRSFTSFISSAKSWKCFEKPLY